MDERENPAAFPVSNATGLNQTGMSLRDWFAVHGLERARGQTWDELALECYAFADAMLAARSKEPE